MHECHRCAERRPVVPDGEVARCPRCGWVDDVARVGPLHLVTGASGAGKSTLLPLLIERLAGECVVLDVDWLIDPVARAGGEAGIDWAAFRDVWLHVAHGISQNGLEPVLLGPFLPQQLEDLPGRAWVGEIRTLVLDCPDDERRRRMTARPAWRARDLDEQVEFGRWLRAHLEPVVDTAATDPAGAADAVAAWVRAGRDSPG